MATLIVRKTLILALLVASASSARAHLTYTGRSFGTFSGLELQSNTITGQTTPNNWGWADGTDVDFGHSHQMRFFRFALQNTALVTITVTAVDPGLMLPGFSIYAGLAHPSPLDYENEITFEYLATLPGPKKEGGFNALGTFRLGNDDSLTYEQLSTFTYMGHAADGTAANYGNAAAILGDGVADGTVTRSFELPAGNYTLAVGGANYGGQGSGPPTVDGANDGADIVPDGVIVEVSVVPEPGVVITTLAGLGFLAIRRRTQPRFFRP
jgi:hypothetical protein